MDAVREARFGRTSRIAARATGAPIAAFCVLDGDRCTVLEAIGVSVTDDIGESDPRFAAMVRATVEAGAPLSSPNGDSLPALAGLPALPGHALGSWLAAPFNVGAGMRGCVVVAHRVPHQWSDEELEIVVDIARAAAQAYGNVSELSARQEMERSLLASEQRYLDLLDGTTEIVISIDGADRLHYANQAGRDALGVTAAEVVGRPVADFVPAERLTAFMAALAQARATGDAFGVDTVLRHLTGRRVVVAGNLWRRGEGGGDVAVEMVFRDISSEQSIRAERERLVATLQATTDVVAVMDVNGLVSWLNDAGRRLIGRAGIQEVVEFPLELLHPKWAWEHAMRESIPQAIKAGVWTGESALRDSLGNEIPVSQVIIAHESARGGVWFLSTIMRDISAMKELDRMKSDFVATVSHELRTPLTSIRGALGLVQGGAAGVVPPKVHDLLGIAVANTERLTRLVNDLLDLNKLEAGAFELHLVPLDPRELIESTVRALAPVFAATSLTVDVRVTATAQLRADRDRLQQVLTNLLSNATKYSPAGGRIAVRVGDVAAAVRIEVEDHGPGIVPADVGRLFQRFQQVGAAVSRKPGTGLGLAIARSLVELHGGRIGVESAPGVCTVFWVELPATRGTPTSVAAVPAVP